MYGIRVTTNLTEFKKHVSDQVMRQVPFAMSTALTELARDVVAAEKKNEVARLDRPREFTTGAIRAIPARKGKYVARVVVMDTTARYLEPYEFGGHNVLNSKALLKPVGAVKDQDRYGNLPRNLLAKLKARDDVFVGTVKTKGGEVTGVWQRASEVGAKVGVLRKAKGGGTRMGKTGKGLNTSGGLKLLIKFADAHPVDDKNRLHWFEVAEVTVTKNFNRRFGAALARAVATSR